MSKTDQTPSPPHPQEKEKAEGSERIVDRELDRQSDDKKRDAARA